MKLVEAINHEVCRPDGHVLQQGISFCLNEGDRLGITGPSGCGKSTFLRQVATSLAEATTDGDTLKISVVSADYLPQGEFLFPWFSPLQNYNAWQGRRLNHPIDEKDLDRAKMLEVDTLLKRRFSELSGGERQRVALWTSLSSDLDLLIVDEPFTALDIERKSTCLEVISDALRANVKALMFVSHDYDILTYLANHILLFDGADDHSVREFSYPDRLPLDRIEYLERRASNKYSNLLQALTQGRSTAHSEILE